MSTRVRRRGKAHRPPRHGRQALFYRQVSRTKPARPRDPGHDVALSPIRDSDPKSPPSVVHLLLVRTPCSPVATSVCTSQRCVATPLYTHPVVLSLCPCTDIPHLCSAGEPRLPSAWNLAKQLNPQVVYNSSRLWVTVPSFASPRLQVYSVWRVTGSQDWTPDTVEGTAITLQREAGPHHALEAPHGICQPSSWSRAMGATFQELAEPLMRHLHSTKRDVKVLAMTSS